MKVDIEDVLFWMDAIRNSDDRYRTLESFWKGQIHSKLWLIDNLKQFTKNKKNNVVIHGGWNGVLAALLFNSDIPVNHITSVDIDSRCEETSRTLNKRYEMQGRFTTVSEDMTLYEYKNTPNIVINTVCEHITKDDYNKWIEKLSVDSLLVLQSNNYDISEHVRIAKSLQEFKEQCNGIDFLWEGSLDLPLYKRWMVIGTKL